MEQLLIGCGNSRRRKLALDGGPTFEGNLTTMDHDPNCGADVLHDMDVTPWPLPSDHFDEVAAYEVLEHLGRQGDYKSFFAHFGEIWRVLKDSGMLYATVPHYSDIWAWSDPSHTRIITKASLVFLSQREYAEQVGKTAMTDFRHIWHGDFEIEAAQVQDGSFMFALRAIKPARYQDTTNNP